jgi:PAS domain S-box-containing protein
MKTDQIVDWRAERLATAAALMENPLFVDGIARWLASRRQEDAEPILTIFRSAHSRESSSDFMLVTPGGQVLLRLDGNLDPIADDMATVLPVAMDERRPMLTEMHTDTRDPAPHLDLVAPLFRQYGVLGEPLGAVILEFDAHDFIYPLIESWPVPSRSAETLLVRKDGDSVLYLDDLRFEKDAALKKRISLDRKDSPAVMAVTSPEDRVVPGTDYRGVAVLSALKHIPDSPWSMVAKVDTAEAFSAWRNQAALILAVVLLLVVSSVTAAGLVWQRHKKAHYRDLAAAQTALGESEERFRMTLTSVGDGVITTDAAGRVRFLNPVAETLTGWCQAEAAGRPLAEVFHIVNEQTRDVVENPAARVLRDGVVVGLANHTILIARGGAECPIADSGAPIRATDGSLAGVVLVFRDQTEHRRAEEALHWSEERYRALIGTAIEGFWVADREGQLLEVNDAYCAMSGYTRDALLSMRIQDIEAQETPADVQAHMQKIVANGSDRFETKHHRADGSLFDVEASVVFLGGQGRFLCFFVDITARKRTEEALRRKSAVDAALAELSAELLKPGERIEDVCPVVLRHALALTESERGYVASIDAKTGVMVNHSLTDMMGDAAAVNEPQARVFPRGADGRYSALWGHSLNTREPFFTNAPPEHPSAAGLPDGHVPVRRFLSVPVIVEDELLGQIALANAPRDYTPEDLESVRRLAELYGMFLRDRRAKENLQQSEHQLHQAMKMEAVGRLAGGVAHDFNNMLQVILSNADMARTEFPPDSPVQECLHEILKAGQRSADLTRQLLAFARKQTIAPRLLDLNEVVGGMLKMLGRLTGEDIRLSWKPAGNLGQVKMDPSQIDQILANLVVNARDAIAGVGKVTIETGNVVLDAAFCEAHAGFVPGSYVLLAVGDDGCGMDQETQAKVFEPFFTTKEVGKGTGLGLATVYGVVKQNDGFIDVHSEPGQGTTFSIYLPWHAAEAPPATAQRERAALPRGTETVLLVEDEASVLRLGKRLLEHLGYTVLAADSPPKAIRMAGETAGVIHLLITDVVMPGMSGRDLWQRLSPTRPSLKCLFMSGYTADIIGRQGVLDEKVHFLGKPFSVEALAAKTREALDGK